METKVLFEAAAEPVGAEPLELVLGCKQAMLKPSKNLPAIVSAGIILPYAAILSVAHLPCTSDHHFNVEAIHIGVQRSVRFSVVQR